MYVDITYIQENENFIAQPFPLNYGSFYTAFHFRENRRHGTDGQTDGRGPTLNVAPPTKHPTHKKLAFRVPGIL